MKQDIENIIKKNEVVGNPNDWHIEVYPRRAGDFGYCSISSIKYSQKEAENLANDMISEIERHVDGVSGTRMIYESYICMKCGNQFENEKEALECNHE